MNEDNVKTQAKDVEDNVKVFVGRIFGLKTLEAEGKLRHAVGRVQVRSSNLKRDFNKGS